MWTEITRPKYDRTGLRYASDLTDAEWRVIEPHMPAPKALGRPRTTDLREVVNAILYVLRSGCCSHAVLPSAWLRVQRGAGPVAKQPWGHGSRLFPRERCSIERAARRTGSPWLDWRRMQRGRLTQRRQHSSVRLSAKGEEDNAKIAMLTR